MDSTTKSRNYKVTRIKNEYLINFDILMNKTESRYPDSQE
jgi:hypothetical protein